MGSGLLTTLADLRTQIDALDTELLRLVDARAALGKAIGEAKAREETANAQVSLLRPDREAMLIRKLLAMPRQAASDGVVVRIWRELISENLRIQGGANGGLHLNLSTAEHSKEVLVWARERFGFAPSFGYVNDATAAIQAARRRGAAWIIAAAPVASDSAFAMMGRLADEAVCVAVPEPFYGVGRFYTDFGQTQDSEVMDLLARAAETKGQSHVS